MAKEKHKYNVYRKYVDLSDEGYWSGQDELWHWMGSTFAVSEAQALNNVQFRIHGDGGHNHGRHRIEPCTHHTSAIPQWIAVKQYSKRDALIYESIQNKKVLPLADVYKEGA